jgi:N-acetylmuramoyl-L-alanine amidase
VIVVDPGHGGAEDGAIGPSGLKEKEVTLDLARRLEQRLEQMDSTLEVVLTREEDRAVALDDRTAVANHERAELFLSIHLNAARAGKARGAETYFLASEASDAAAQALAAKENVSTGASSATVEDGSERDLQLVLWDLAQNEHLAESSALAELVQAQLNALGGTRDRGVRQAPFRVLMGATMPAVLVEVGFISNHEEEAQLQTAAYRAQVVEAIAVAVQSFLEKAARLTGRVPAAATEAGQP